MFIKFRIKKKEILNFLHFKLDLTAFELIKNMYHFNIDSDEFHT